MLIKRKVSFNVSLLGPENPDEEPYLALILSWYRKHLKVMKENWELKSVSISHKDGKFTITYNIESDGSWIDLIDRQVCNADDYTEAKIKIGGKEYRIIPENIEF